MKKIIVILTILLSVNAFSQVFNSYEHLIIPSKFEFQKTENQYGVNSLVEAYFKQQGFQVLFDKDITKEMSNNRCNAVYTDIIRENSMFSTKITVVLKDCEGKKLLVSSEGVSRSKEFDVAHREAVRIALKSIPNQNYVYQDKVKSVINDEKLSVPVALENSNNSKVDIIKSDNSIIVETLSNGFLLIDSASSKIILKLFNTNTKDIFIATSTAKYGIVTRQKDKIIFEYILNNTLLTEILNVKF